MISRITIPISETFFPSSGYTDSEFSLCVFTSRVTSRAEVTQSSRCVTSGAEAPEGQIHIVSADLIERD